jgi:N-acetylmuramoyl-L-alanine amidase
MVLWRSKMPSILIETGFISNKQERAYLQSEEGQVEIANAVAKSVEQYKKQVENLK